MKQAPKRSLNRNTLSEFWFQLHQFLRTRRKLARQMGLDGTEYELMLMLRALPQAECPSISLVAERLFLQHHIAAATVKRLVARGLVISERSNLDRRSLTLRLTPPGQELVEEIVQKSIKGLETEGPRIMHSLAQLMKAEEEEIGDTASTRSAREVSAGR